MPNLFSKLLREWRESRKWTLLHMSQELARHNFDYDQSTLGKYERKERIPPGEFLAHLTCIGLSHEKATEWAYAIGTEFSLDILINYERARRNQRC